MFKKLKEKETLHYIAGLEEVLLNSFKTSDVFTLDKLLDDNLFFHNQYGEVIDKETDLAIHRSGNLKIKEINLIQREMRLFGQTVVVSVSLGIEGTFAGTPFKESCRYLRVWKKKGNWRVISASCTFISKEM